MISELKASYLKKTGGNYVRAAALLACDLMQDDPETFKAGYSLENAVIAAQEMFPAADCETITKELQRRVVRT